MLCSCYAMCVCCVMQRLFMLCCAMFRYVMLSYAMLRHVMLWYAMLCYVMLCYGMVWYAMLCYAMPCRAMLCYAMLMPCYVMLCYVSLKMETTTYKQEVEATIPERFRHKRLHMFKTRQKGTRAQSDGAHNQACKMIMNLMMKENCASLPA